ncbi:hypothetical protein [Lysobacter tyrosinilyticus]
MRTLPKLAAALGGVLALVLAHEARAGGLVEFPFDIGNFNAPLAIDNPYMPLIPGMRVVFSEVSADECVIDEVEVTNDSKNDFQGAYAGLTARVVLDHAWQDADCDGDRDLLLEDTIDWYAQDDDGNVWYVGEDTTAYGYDEEGNLLDTSKEGSWETGSDGAIAGLIMLAESTPGDFYQQEFREGVAQDEAKVVGVNRKVTTGLGTFDGCLITKEWSPLSRGSIEHKYYCPTAGGLVLVHEFHGKTTIAEAIEIEVP